MLKSLYFGRLKIKISLCYYIIWIIYDLHNNKYNYYFNTIPTLIVNDKYRNDIIEIP